MNNAQVSWKSRLQRTVSLSSCEAECIALSEACSELLHIKQIIESMGITIACPMNAPMDDMGAMFLANNESSSRTKHIDGRCHFLRNVVQGPNPIIKINFVCSKHNKADGHTQNVATTTFETHFPHQTSKKESKNQNSSQVEANDSPCMNANHNHKQWSQEEGH